MLTRHLGKTGIEASVLGLGTVKFGRNTQVKYPRPFELPSDGQIADLLSTAKRLGVNLLDTAPAYGSSEERLGEAITGEREDWLLCTKAGERFDGNRSHYDFSEERILRSVDESLRRLRTDTLDIVLVHADGRSFADIAAAGAMRALRRLQREGVVRAVGFSGKGTVDSEAALPCVDVLMCAVNSRQRQQVPLVERAGQASVGVLVKKPMASGKDDNAEAPALVARLPGVTSVLTGTLSADHLAANAAAIGAQLAVGS